MITEIQPDLIAAGAHIQVWGIGGAGNNATDRMQE